MNSIQIIVMSADLFICGLILLKREKKRGDWFLFLFFLLMLAGDIQQIWFPDEATTLIDITLITFAPVFFFHHILSLRNTTIRAYYLWSYALPFFFILTCLYALLSKDSSVFISMGFRVYLFTAIFLMVIYGVLAINYSYGKEISNCPSEVQAWSIKLSWVYLIYFGLMTIIGFSIDDVKEHEKLLPDLLNNSLSQTLVLLILFWGYKYGILYPLHKHQTQNDDTLEIKPNSASDITLFQKIDEQIRTEKLFQNEQLTLAMLSKKMKVNQKYLSQAVNNTQKKSFTTYINELRINYFVTLIEDKEYKHFSFEALARESGFNSISTFNRTFKSITGVTPSEYRNLNLK